MLVHKKKILLKKHEFNRGGFNNSCLNSHTGPICGDCSKGFSKLGDVCVECLNSSVNMTRIIVATIGYITFLLIYVM